MLNRHIRDANPDGRESIGNAHDPLVAPKRHKTKRNGFIEAGWTR